MRVIFALGGNAEKQFAPRELKVRSFLVSFYYKNLIEFLDNCPHCDYLLLDSGAFSAWTVGASINLDEYINWVHQIKKRFGSKIKRIECINLDVIPSEDKTPTALKKAYDDSMTNLYKMMKAGLNPLPVHHQFEPWSILEDYSKDFKFICLSPNKRVPIKDRATYLDNCFARIKANNLTHGLGVSKEDFIINYPWFSADSSVAFNPYRFGSMPVKHKRFDVKYCGKRSRNPNYTQLLAFKTIESLLETEETATNLWQKRGITWQV